MAGTNVDKIHVSATTVMSLAVPLLIWVWAAQASELEQTAKVAAENTKAIAVLVKEAEDTKEDIEDIKQTVESNRKSSWRIEKQLIRIGAKLEVGNEYDTASGQLEEE